MIRLISNARISHKLWAVSALIMLFMLAQGIVTRYGTIQEISAIAVSIGGAVEEQGTATAEIARSVQQTAQSTRQVTANMAHVSRTAHQTGVTAHQSLDAASGLSR